MTLPGVAHFPHLEDPGALAAALDGFLSATEPADYDDERLAEILALRASTAPREAAGIASSARP